MKGLLLKDYYTAKNYLRSLFWVAFVFIAASFFNDYVFFLYYPCVFPSALLYFLYLLFPLGPSVAVLFNGSSAAL